MQTTKAFLYNDIKITTRAGGVLQELFASESDLNLSQAENPPVEVTLLAREGWQRLIIPAWSSPAHCLLPPSLLAPGYFQLSEATVAQCANRR